MTKKGKGNIILLSAIFIVVLILVIKCISINNRDTVVKWDNYSASYKVIEK